jgi:hypothetical protein
MGSVRRRFPMRGAERKPFGADDFDVADAEEGEDRAQIFLLEVVSLEWHSRCVKSPPRDEAMITRLPPASPIGASAV